MKNLKGIPGGIVLGVIIYLSIFVIDRFIMRINDIVYIGIVLLAIMCLMLGILKKR
jgi:hypothetical protein